MKNSLITLTCDFGDHFAASQVESIIYSLNPAAKFILASNEVTPYSITEGSFIIQKLSQLTPPSSIHVGVIDPGVGSDRIGIIIQTNNYWFIGPNNGLLVPASDQDGIKRIFQINEKKIGSLSNTFHGRDIFAKVASFISLDKPIEEFAIPLHESQLLQIKHEPNQILHIDPYGNLKINNPGDYIVGDKLHLKINEKSYIIPFVKTFAQVNTGEPLAYKGSHQTLELAINQANAAKYFKLQVGQTIQIQKVGDQSNG